MFLSRSVQKCGTRICRRLFPDRLTSVVSGIKWNGQFESASKMGPQQSSDRECQERYKLDSAKLPKLHYCTLYLTGRDAPWDPNGRPSSRRELVKSRTSRALYTPHLRDISDFESSSTLDQTGISEWQQLRGRSQPLQEMYVPPYII